VILAEGEVVEEGDPRQVLTKRQAGILFVST